MAALDRQRTTRDSDTASASPKRDTVRALSSDDGLAEKISGMQQTLGNQTVQRMASACPAFPSACPTGGTCHTCPTQIQTELKTSEPRDLYEQDAERVIRQPVVLTPPKPFDHLSSNISEVPPIVHEVLCSPGQPLDPEIREFMGPKFGRDFSSVRVHSDEKAAMSAQAVKAFAYTVGHNVVFGENRYDPNTKEGRWLLAHELAHTVQQSGGRGMLQGRDIESGEDASSEVFADRAADAVISGATVPCLGRTSGISLHRYAITRVEPVNRDEQLVHTDSGIRYRIRRVRWLSEQTERVGWGRVVPGIDRQRVWLDIEWCAGMNHGTVQIGANVPEQVIQTVVNAVTSGRDIKSVIEGLDITPYAQLTMLQSGSFRLMAGGEVTIDMRGQVTSSRGRLGVSVGPVDVDITAGPGQRGGAEVQGRVTITPGRSTEREECRRERRRIVENTRYECTLEREIPFRKEQRTRTVHDEEQRFIYFEYASDVIHPRSAEEIRLLDEKLRNGFRVSAIRGFTSPEGPMLRGRRFMGNEELARRRARAAAELVRSHCPPEAGASSCLKGGDEARVTGEGELYSLVPLDAEGVVHEVEGRELASHATAEFLTQPEEEPHRTPELVEQIEKATTPERQADLVYPLLRRAQVTIVRTRTEKYMEKIPGRTETETIRCPEDVVERASPRAAEALR